MSFANPYTYTGRRLDSETGLYQYRNRYYHAQLGRFVSRDPIAYAGSQWNLYEYVGSSPISETDPLGLSALALCATVFGADFCVPELTDLVPHKWLGWGCAFAGAACIDAYCYFSDNERQIRAELEDLGEANKHRREHLRRLKEAKSEAEGQGDVDLMRELDRQIGSVEELIDRTQDRINELLNDLFPKSE